MKNVSRKTRAVVQQGFTLIELLIVISLIAIMSAVIFFNFNDHKAKGELLLTAAQQLAGAAKRMQVETSCYPTNVTVLFDQKMASTSAAANTCNIDLTTWSGPYMDVRPVNTDNSLILNQIGPSVRAGFQQLGPNGKSVTLGANATASNTTGLTNTGSLPNQYAVAIGGVPGNIARQFMIACLGNSSTAGSNGSNEQGVCLVNGQETTSSTAVKAQGNYLNYVFAQSNESYLAS